uniref:BZIP domain-containing protein n=1 Tax=Anopheles epiroticus TaxID=199890 RepID=A0A182PAN8_9DIPT
MEEKHHSDAPRAEVEDQFQCKTDGCKQTVPTDGYCTLHSKKHDLSLNLQMPQKTTGGGLLFADQTPTPTRLIGKCEEVGLFEDLQKVNPFDETFRRAVESGASSVCSSDDQSPLIPSFSVPCCRAVEGETLHTPHIFPSGIDRSSLLDGIASGSEKNAAAKQQKPKNKASGSSPRGKQQQQQPQPQQTQPQQTQPQQTQPQSQQQQQLQAKQVEQPPKSTMATNSTTPTNKPKSVKKTPAKRKTPAAAVEILPKPSTTQSSLITDEPIPLIIIPPDHVPDTTLPAEGIVLVKKKLKEHLAKVRETGPLQKESAPAVKKAKRSEQKPDTSNKVTKPTDLPDALNERAILKQERWKAAAKRYRMRLKISQDQQLQRNIELEAENHRLRTQLAEMKAAHRNCNVTCSSKLVQVNIK